MNKKQRILEVLSELSSMGLISVATINGLIGDPETGNIITSLVKNQLYEFLDSILSKRQQHRSISVSAYAIDYVNQRLERGHKLRDDDFFTPGEILRSDAEEIVDAMLFSVKDESQEKKIPFISNLVSNVAFTESISADSANYYLKVLEQITYRQLIMFYFAWWNEKDPPDAKKIRPEWWVKLSPISWVTSSIKQVPADENLQILQELSDLSLRGFLSVRLAEIYPNFPNASAPFRIIPNTIMPSVISSNILTSMYIMDHENFVKDMFDTKTVNSILAALTKEGFSSPSVEQTI